MSDVVLYNLSKKWCEIGALHTKSLKAMYINNEERKAKIGKINVSVSRDNSIKLRFREQREKVGFSISAIALRALP